MTSANEQERAQIGELAEHIQQATGENVQLAYLDQGYTGEEPARQAQAHGIRLEVVKLSEAKKGFVLLSKGWLVERSFGWAALFKLLSRDYERLASRACPKVCVSGIGLWFGFGLRFLIRS